MDTTPATGSRFALEPFRALRLADSYVGDPIANRVFARPYRSVPGRLRDWRRKRHLRLDARPALYLHEYTSAGVSIRGIVALLDLNGAAGRVVPPRGRAPRPDAAARRPDGRDVAQPGPDPAHAPRTRVGPRGADGDRRRPARPHLHRPRRPAAADLADHRPPGAGHAGGGPHRCPCGDRRRPPPVRRRGPAAGAARRHRLGPDPGDAHRPGRHPAPAVRDPPHHPPADADHRREGLRRSAATTSAGTPAATRHWPSSRTPSSCTTVSTGRRCGRPVPHRCW